MLHLSILIITILLINLWNALIKYLFLYWFIKDKIWCFSLGSWIHNLTNHCHIWVLLNLITCKFLLIYKLSILFKLSLLFYSRSYDLFVCELLLANNHWLLLSIFINQNKLAWSWLNLGLHLIGQICVAKLRLNLLFLLL